MRNRSRYALATGLVLVFTLACTEKQEVKVDFSSKGGLGSKDVYGGIANYINHPAGSSRRKADYLWDLFTGHDIAQIRLHFSELELLNDNLLIITDSFGNELQRFDSTQAGEQWTDTYDTNLIRLQLLEDASPNDARTHFSIDRVDIWSSGILNFLNHPAFEVWPFSKWPNVHALQPVASDKMRPRTNREVWGIVGAGQMNYYVTGGAPFTPFDFATIANIGGPPESYDHSRDLWYSERDDAVVVGQYGGDPRDDVVVITERNGIFVALTTGPYEFGSFHIAERHFELQADELLAAGKMNHDDADDLLAVTPTDVRFLINNGDPLYPQFASEESTSLPWTLDVFPPGTEFTPITGDFDGDEYVDIGVVVDQKSESHLPEDSWDQIHIFRNNGDKTFTAFATWKRPGVADGGANSNRKHLVADIDGNGCDDLVLMDLPKQVTTHNMARAYVSLNRYCDSPPDVFVDRRLWRNMLLAPWDPMGEQLVISDVVIGDYNGDGRSDIALKYSMSRRLFSLGGYPTYVYTPRWINVSFTHTDTSGSGVVSGPEETWTPPTFPKGDILAGRFTSDLMGETLMADHGSSLRVHLYILENRLFPLSGSTAGSGFGNPIDRLVRKRQYQLGDVDGDGREDVVVFTADGRGTVEVLLNVGDVSGVHTDQRFEPSGHPWAIDFANDFRAGHEYPLVDDVNGDGYADLILFSGHQPSFVGDDNFFPNGVFVAINQKNEHFAPAVRWNSLLSVALSTGLRTPLVGDYNGDGSADIAIASPMGQVSWALFVALSTGSRFGLGGDDLDWSETIGMGTAPRAFKVADMDGNNHDDIVALITHTSSTEPPQTEGLIRSYRSIGTGDLEDHNEFPIALAGTAEDNVFEVGHFSGDEYADIVVHLSEAEMSTADKNHLYAWYSREGSDWTPQPVAGYKAHHPYQVPKTEAADLEGDGRDELVLIREGAHTASAVELLALKFTHSDVDLYAQPAIGSIKNLEPGVFELPPGMPQGGWSASSAQPLIGTELVADQASLSGGHVVGVHNNGSDAIAYKLISNQVLWRATLDALYMTDDDISSELYWDFVYVVKETGPRLYDATDGFFKLRRVNLWQPDDPSWWEDRCDNRSDIYVYDRSGRAHARRGCHMALFMCETYPATNKCVDTDPATGKTAYKDDGGVMVHEYGHSGFLLSDEYCEKDPGESSAANSCTFSISCLPAEVCARGLCPNSLMGASSQREFCTLLYHAPFGGIKQVAPSWEDIWSPALSGSDSNVGPQRPRWTPNLHSYSEGQFKGFLKVCAGDTDDCYTP